MTIAPALPAPRSLPPLLWLVPPPSPHSQAPLPEEGPGEQAAPDDRVCEDERRVAGSVTRALAEVLAGRRPQSQVRPVLAPRVARLLEHLVRSRAARGMHLASPVRVQAPCDGVLEACARLAHQGRGAAVAIRLERRPHRWVVVSLEAGLAEDGRVPARS